MRWRNAIVGLMFVGACQLIELTPEQEEQLCELGRGRICDGLDVVEMDLCAGTNTKIETCEHACHLGSCVDCAPDAATICEGDAVHSMDSCGVTGDLIQSCDSGCAQGQCVDPSCTPDAGLMCVGNNVYHADSCQHAGAFAQRCPTGCLDGACLDCETDAFRICYHGDVYSLDSCQQLGDVYRECPEGQTCSFNGTSIGCEAGLSCTLNSAYTCFQNNLHYVDSCGNVQDDVYQSCDNGCDSGGCVSCLRSLVGATCVGNDRHELLGGCGQPNAPGARIETCEHGCQLGACLTGTCRPNAGAVCVGDDRYAIDSCGVRGAKIETCAGGCSDGVCEASCTPAGTVCGDDGNVHAVDSCGNVNATVKEACGDAGCADGACRGESPCASSCMSQSGAVCCTSCGGCTSVPENLACVPVCGSGYSWDCEMQCCYSYSSHQCEGGQTCSPAGTVCGEDGNVYEIDSCGNLGASPKQFCELGCEGGSGYAYCSAGTEPRCQCDSGCYVMQGTQTAEYCDCLTNAAEGCGAESLCPEICGPVAMTCPEGTLTYAGWMTLGDCSGCGGSGTCYDSAMCETYCAN